MSVTTQPKPVDLLRSQLTRMASEFANALPSHIKPEKFQRVVMTVVQQQPDLLSADRGTLLAACTKCAADGLVPDGREAALVIFNTKKKIDGTEKWVKAVQYMPMLGGILKRARNSGEIAGIIVNVVHEADEFLQRPDDFEKPLEHRPPKLGVSRGKVIGAYALAKLKDGTVMHEVMDREEIEKVRAASRSKDSGPWVQWWDQMARKTVFRRLSKYLPMDAEADDLMRRDDQAGAPTAIEAPTIEGAAETPAAQIAAPSKLDALESTADLTGEIDGEVMDGEFEDASEEPKDLAPAREIASTYRRCATEDEIRALDRNPGVVRQMKTFTPAAVEIVETARGERVGELKAAAA
jgi:recombination protein RecT